MDHVTRALNLLSKNIKEREQRQSISFASFLSMAVEKPEWILRNIFQVFHDMVRNYLGEGVNEYPDDSESIGFDHFDCANLFVKDADHPFFADRIFANRFVNHVEAMKSGVQQNKIYIFDGPPGCGKSTFLNNLLMKFEEYANTEAGTMYEVVWRLDRQVVGGMTERDAGHLVDRLAFLLGRSDRFKEMVVDQHEFAPGPKRQDEFTAEWAFPSKVQDFIEVGCPSHDHPILLIPKSARATFLREVFKKHDFQKKLFSVKEYEWVFRQNPCNICLALSNALLDRLDSPAKVFEMIHARPYKFNRRLGEGISVYNPGDKPPRQPTMTNPMVQTRLNEAFRDSNQVQYVYSQYAKTNNGIYALMDIKSNNTERLIELHNIVSEGVHKVEYFEENVNSLFLAVMNPEDKTNFSGIPSFSDRIQYVDVPYVLDYQTEVEIYRHIFGRDIDQYFLPQVLSNFARVIISTRLAPRSEALSEWIKQPERYRLYCDDNLQLLKMDLYTGYIPVWLSEEDRKSFTAKRRRRFLEESHKEGKKGLSGRDSIKKFGEFFAKYAREDGLIDMAMLCNYFTKSSQEISQLIPTGFLDSVLRMYDYIVLQEVKESLYNYNEQQISRDIQNYVFALNFEPGTVVKCAYTEERLEVSESYLESIETRLIGAKVDRVKRAAFRKDVLRDYTGQTLTQEILVEGRPMNETRLFQALHERYVHNLKQRVLDPIIDNENFRRGIVDHGTEAFKTYDKRVRDDVTFLIANLSRRYGYTSRGAQTVSLYVIDHGLPKKFAS